MPSVYISPSSQEHNMYASGGTEEQWMNKIADEVIPLLNFNGIKTYRNTTSMDLNAIIRDSNNKNPDIHVAIHSNAGCSRGCEVFVYKEPNKTTNSEKLGKYVYNEISAITPTSDRGLKDGKATRLGEIVNIKATSILIEVDFHDNKEGSEWIKSNVDNISKSIAKGLCKYFGIVYREKVSEQKQYLVYGSKLLGNGYTEQYAKDKAAELKEQGFINIYYIKPDGSNVDYK